MCIRDRPCSLLTGLSVHYIINLVCHWQDYQFITSSTLFVIDRTISSLCHQPCLSLTWLSVHYSISLVLYWQDSQFITSSTLFVIDRTISLLHHQLCSSDIIDRTISSLHHQPCLSLTGLSGPYRGDLQQTGQHCWEQSGGSAGKGESFFCSPYKLCLSSLPLFPRACHHPYQSAVFILIMITSCLGPNHEQHLVIMVSFPVHCVFSCASSYLVSGHNQVLFSVLLPLTLSLL